MKIAISELLTYSTIRIDTFGENGGTGTGFFFNFCKDLSENLDMLAIVTNWHVVKEVSLGELIFTKADVIGNPLDTEHINVVIENFESSWIRHPDLEVDLCILPLKSIINKIPSKFYYGAYDLSHIPTDEEVENLCAIEEIIMIGYPDGIWDDYNNKPIVRKGITATSPRLPYRGENEFMIDMTCITGSSGSPILIFNTGQYLNRNDDHFFIKYRIILLGILYSGSYYSVEGEIVHIDIPSKKQKISQTYIPLNLGRAITANKILDFICLI